MRRRALRACLVLVLTASALSATPVRAAPVSGPHETVENSLTTTQPGAASGFSFTGTYHAAGDTGANPPYMRKMIFYSPPGMRYDTTVPERCSASDIELEIRGVAACPAGSRLGGGTTTTSFLGRYPSTIAVDLFNNTGEEVILARSPLVSTVARGHILSDGSIEFASPTCFPSVGPAGCPIDDVLQLKSTLTVPAYTRPSDGASYLTTPLTCPAKGAWRTPVRLWWADGSVDTLVTEQPCARRRPPVRNRR